MKKKRERDGEKAEQNIYFSPLLSLIPHPLPSLYTYHGENVRRERVSSQSIQECLCSERGRRERERELFFLIERERESERESERERDER